MDDFDRLDQVLLYASNTLNRKITEDNVVQSVMELMYNEKLTPVDLRYIEDESQDYGNYQRHCLDSEHTFFEMEIDDTPCLVDFDTSAIYEIETRNNHKSIRHEINVSWHNEWKLMCMTEYYKRERYVLPDELHRLNAKIRMENNLLKHAKEGRR